jgi:hypothetical protein
MNGPSNPPIFRRASPGANLPEVPVFKWLGGQARPCTAWEPSLGPRLPWTCPAWTCGNRGVDSSMMETGLVRTRE